MKLYAEEWDCAVRYQQTHSAPRLTESQLQVARETGKRFVQWSQSHAWLHNTLNLIVLAALLAADLAALLLVPVLLMPKDPTTANWLLTLTVVSCIHGFVSYSIIIFTMHEGAAHDRIIIRTGRLTSLLAILVNNLCRICFADPVYYRSRHTHHHADFGTQEDGAFTNFVWPRRFLVSLLPGAGALDFNDYRIHQDTRFSWSRLWSCVAGTLYAVAVGALIVPHTGILFFFLVFAITGPWISFLLDRLRETTEHNLMALDNENGARNLGLGFWALLVGGGPWGQPCHLSHHLMPALPWYQQCRLHLRLRALMTPEQKQHFCIRPIVGFPKLLWHVLQVNFQYARDLMTSRTTQSSGDSA